MLQIEETVVIDHKGYAASCAGAEKQRRGRGSEYSLLKQSVFPSQRLGPTYLKQHYIMIPAMFVVHLHNIAIWQKNEQRAGKGRLQNECCRSPPSEPHRCQSEVFPAVEADADKSQSDYANHGGSKVSVGRWTGPSQRVMLSREG